MSWSYTIMILGIVAAITSYTVVQQVTDAELRKIELTKESCTNANNPNK